MQTTIKKSAIIAGVQDWLTPAFLGATVIPFFLLLVTTLALIIGFFSDISTWMETGSFQTGIADWLNSWPSGLHFLSSWLLNSVVLGVSTILLALFLFSLALLGSIFGGLMALSVLTPWITGTIHRRHYSWVELKSFGNPITSLAYTIFVIVAMAIVIVLTLPIYFIPVIGFLAFNLMAYVLFEKLLVRDVASTMMSRDEYARIRDANRFALHGISFVCYCLSLIPILGLFLQVLFVCILAHFFFGAVCEVRASPSSS